MAWATMHFAVGMACTAAAGAGLCLGLGRGWRWLPLAMAGGGCWAMIPDMPRFFRYDYPNAPVPAFVRGKPFQLALDRWGDLFFFHRMLDSQPRELALHGMIACLLLFVASIALLMWLESRTRRRLRALQGRLAQHEHHSRRARRRLVNLADEQTDRPGACVAAPPKPRAPGLGSPAAEEPIQAR